MFCICNDRDSQKMKSLKNNCWDLKFTRPSKEMLARRLMTVCKEEGIAVANNAVQPPHNRNILGVVAALLSAPQHMTTQGVAYHHLHCFACAFASAATAATVTRRAVQMFLLVQNKHANQTANGTQQYSLVVGVLIREFRCLKSCASRRTETSALCSTHCRSPSRHTLWQ